MKGKLFFCTLLCAAIMGCEEKKNVSHTTPKSKGLSSELLLVVDKAVWESTVADTLNLVLEGPIPGLPQQEPHFRVTRIFSQHYVQRYSTFHSKLYVNLDKNLDKPMMGISYDVCAKPQIEVVVKAKDTKDLGDFIGRNKDYIRDVITDAQVGMRMANLKRKYSQKANTEMQAAMGRKVFAPEGIRFSKRGKDFLWLGANLIEKDMNIVAYTYPWDGGNALQPYRFAQVRDSVMRENIPGSEPDQWMETVWENGLPVVHSRLRMIGGKRVQEVRGLWQMRNGALGGPFVSLTQIDTAANNVFVAEGFAYSPSTEKRELVRTMEAALRTIK